MRNPLDPFDKRIDLPAELRADLRAAERDYYNVVCFTHLDDDHCCGAGDFFWLDHARKYQGEGRIKIRELWVPAAAILEDGCEDSARIIRQEARHRLREGYGIRVFSRPKKLRAWLEAQGLTLESRDHLITDAGNVVSTRAAQASGAQDSARTRDAVATTAAVIIFWPAAFLVGGDKQTAAELGQLKGQMVAIEQASIQKKCGIQFQTAKPQS